MRLIKHKYYLSYWYYSRRFACNPCLNWFIRFVCARVVGPRGDITHGDLRGELKLCGSERSDMERSEEKLFLSLGDQSCFLRTCCHRFLMRWLQIRSIYSASSFLLNVLFSLNVIFIFTAASSVLRKKATSQFKVIDTPREKRYFR